MAVVSMEQTVDFLVTNPGCRSVVDKKDLNKLHDLRKRIWLSGSEITQRQQELIQSIVSKYLLLLQQQGWSVQDLLTPTWSTPVRHYVPVTVWSITLEDDQWIVKFPYHGPTVYRLREVAEHHSMYDLIEWIPADLSWRIHNGPQGRKLVQQLLSQNTHWQCSQEHRHGLRTDQVMQPVITYLNGAWQHSHASDTLGPLLDRVIAQNLPQLQTVLALADYAVEFDHRARNYLKNWLTPSQVQMLCDSDPIIEISQVPELRDLLDLVNCWPVVLVQNRWDPDNQIQLNLAGVPVHRHWTYSQDAHTFAYQMDVRGFSQLVSLPEPAILEFSLGYPPELQLPQSLRVPWLVRCPSMVDQYTLQSADHYVRHNYNRHIRVVPDSIS